jgi:hypothetical protein
MIPKSSYIKFFETKKENVACQMTTINAREEISRLNQLQNTLLWRMIDADYLKYSYIDEEGNPKISKKREPNEVFIVKLENLDQLNINAERRTNAMTWWYKLTYEQRVDYITDSHITEQQIQKLLEDFIFESKLAWIQFMDVEEQLYYIIPAYYKIISENTIKLINAETFEEHTISITNSITDRDKPIGSIYESDYFKSNYVYTEKAKTADFIQEFNHYISGMNKEQKISAYKILCEDLGVME